VGNLRAPAEKIRRAAELSLTWRIVMSVAQLRSKERQPIL
jgi:hypothetical protein